MRDDYKHLPSIYILLLLFITSFQCTMKESANCNVYSEKDKKKIDYLLNKKIVLKNTKVPSIRSYDNLIQYYGRNSWGSFHHIVTFYTVAEEYFIQLIQLEQKRGNEKKYYQIKETALQNEQVQQVFAIVENLKCSAFNLDPFFSEIDGNDYSLIIKQKNEITAFEWQLHATTTQRNNETIKSKNKEQVLAFIGFLLKTSGLEPSKKIISISDQNTIKEDSMFYEISLTNYYLTKKYDYYFDDIPIKTLEGKGVLSIPVLDTFNLKNRIKVIETQIDNTVRIF